MRTIGKISLLWICACTLAAGCDSRPAPPEYGFGRPVKSVIVSPSDDREYAAVTALETARITYRFNLTVLQAYYSKVGNLDRYGWTVRELKNLDATQTFKWIGLPAISPPEQESLDNVDEQILAERVAASRKRYLTAMETLSSLYRSRGENINSRLLKNMQERFYPHETYTYFGDAEIPPADLKPSAIITEANSLFAKGYKLYRDGKNLDIPFIADINKQREAIDLFRELIEKYPTSDKIALAAFYIGDIYREYVRNYPLAVKWFERAWQWDPNINRPARFNAAVTYEFFLHNRTRAVELYQLSIKYESSCGNPGFAKGRLKDLTGNPNYVPPASPPPKNLVD